MNTATYNAAINILADQAVRNGKPANPDAYHAKVRTTLTADHRNAARTALTANPDLTAADLADMLGEHKVIPAKWGAPAARRPVTECAVCGSPNGFGWLPVERDALGICGDAEPCPSCSHERHRYHQGGHGERDAIYERYAISVERMQEPTA